jgi:glycosylphosphatidylinositol transamidase (GPIT) subunit GPI8
MHAKGLYKEAFVLLDTCEAASMFDDIVAPNLFLLGTSKHDESAVSDMTDGVLNTNR